ncbi:MAG: aldehyde dehydrogenase family protein [Oligoflexales bacterium]|nr:aldehyde dehydrogenase family protein [Oligoflexales bacterium]
MKRTDLFIDGEWKKASKYKPIHSPYNGEKIAEVGQAQEEDISAAIDAASRAFPLFSKTPAHRRADILNNFASIMRKRRTELAEIVANEAAKPIKTAFGEVDRTVQTYLVAAEEAKRIEGHTLPLDAAPGGEGRFTYTVRKPIGIIGAITPFNFPFNLVAHKVGPALAAGNCVILKPASQTPLSSLVLGEIAAEASLPGGVLNILPGDGGTVGERIVTDPRIAAVTFTGSPEVGIAMKNKAGLKRVTLELGSNSAVIIDRDTDLEGNVVTRCVWGAFVNNGQVCISLQRIYVHNSLYQKFLDKFIEEARKLKIGSPLDQATDITALISTREVDRVDKWVSEAISMGATARLGGQRLSERIYPPTVLTEVPPSANISCQEAFAPVVTITPFSCIKEAFEHVNNSKFGLQAGIYTKDINTAMAASEDLQVGGVMINDIPTFRVDHMPYGGVKQSGCGREGVRYAIEEMTEIKLISIKL